MGPGTYGGVRSAEFSGVQRSPSPTSLPRAQPKKCLKGLYNRGPRHPHIGALIIRIGFRGLINYTCNREPHGNSIGPYGNRGLRHTPLPRRRSGRRCSPASRALAQEGLRWLSGDLLRLLSNSKSNHNNNNTNNSNNSNTNGNNSNSSNSSNSSNNGKNSNSTNSSNNSKSSKGPFYGRFRKKSLKD